MEKIQIQFNESDYTVYHDYCLKYYQAHDTARKQSVHTFLDLFGKGFIPVEKQEIKQARELITRKCDEQKKERNAAGSGGDTTISLRMQVCSDILFFIDDLEKIYRLIQKKGIVADYLMILGTFSRIIDESRNSPPVKYSLKHELVESLASPLAGMIRLRLDADGDWQSVLRELTFIAARFNQHFSGPKFDLDILQPSCTCGGRVF